MRVDADVLVERVHELPGVGLAPHLQPARDVEEARSRRRRVGHDDLALVDRLGQILPAGGLRQVELLRLHGVEADRGAIDVHADPARRIL